MEVETSHSTEVSSVCIILVDTGFAAFGNINLSVLSLKDSTFLPSGLIVSAGLIDVAFFCSDPECGRLIVRVSQTGNGYFVRLIV